ncbi:hypothetical protein [Streptosporangium roseum]|uniref:hypothetical protein n=1 Tax=Streptosporangium roseum TaxID=2001 RepID=UPI00332938FD
MEVIAESVDPRDCGLARWGVAYRLRFQWYGEMRTHPEIFTTRADAEGALWKMGWTARPTAP